MFFPEAKESLAEYVRSADARKATLAAVQSLIDTLVLARTALMHHSHWRRPTTSTGVEISDYPDLLNRWLERTALLDLLQKDRVVQATLQEAQSAGWSSDELTVTRWVSALGPARDLPAIDRYVVRDVRAYVDALQHALRRAQGVDAYGGYRRLDWQGHGAAGQGAQ